eukprot:225258_1
MASVLPSSGLKGDPDNPRSIGGDSPPIDVAMETAIRPLLDLVDRLRSHGIEDELSLPQIAVMGDQSSGKSSVLEALSGVQFPRGSGLVTRCPVQLIMKRSNAGSPWKAKAHIAWHNPARKAAVISSSIDPIKEQAEEIIIQSDSELAGVMSSLMEISCTSAPNGFSSDSVVVEIESPSSPDLTLIDLPGIVRTAVEGQSREVISQVNGMIDTHLTQERTIILAIVPANQDVATVDILERARRVDPQGLRTIGVLTKPDLVGPGNEQEALEVLYNKRKPLALGYVMVRCRTQKELSEGATMAGAQKAEADFFQTHSVFKKLCHEEKQRVGIGMLTSQCVNLLMERIKHSLPQMKWELQEKLLCVEDELKPLPNIIPKDSISRVRAMVQIITSICRLLRASIAGEYRDPLLNSLPELRIRSSVDRYFRSLQKGIAEIEAGFDHPSFPHELQEQLKEHRGREVCGIVNSQFFFIFMLKQIEQFRPIVEKMRNEIYLSVLGVASEVVRLAAPQYPRVVERIGSKVEECIREVGDLIEPELDSMFEKERNPFTENSELEEAVNQMRFERFDRMLHQVLLEAGEKPLPPGESKTGSTFKDSQFGPQGINQLQDWVTMQLGQWYRYSHGANPTSKVEDMSTILQAYWRVTSKRLCENACMLLETTFLSGVVDSLEFRLLAYSQELEKEGLEDMFVEDRAIAQKRQMLEGRKERLRAGLLDISEAFPECVAVSRRVHTTSYGKSVESGGSNRSLNDHLVDEDVSSVSPHVTSGLTSPSLIPKSFSFGEKSEPEIKADILCDGSFAKLNPPVTFDTPNAAELLLRHGGLLHWLGTGRDSHAFENPHDRGDVSVTCRGIITGDIRMLVDSGGGDNSSLSELIFDHWVCIDLGVNRMLSPTHLALRNGSSRAGCDLTNWVLEGYSSPLRMWVMLQCKSGSGPLSVTSPFGCGAWEIQPAVQDRVGKAGYDLTNQRSSNLFRFLRLRSTGRNGEAGLGLPICRIEFFGSLHARPDL